MSQYLKAFAYIFYSIGLLYMLRTALMSEATFEVFLSGSKFCAVGFVLECISKSFEIREKNEYQPPNPIEFTTMWKHAVRTKK